MTTVDITEPGLRERKRLATRRAIQLATLDLVTDHGLDGVTIDDISRVADISPRTFFNYFTSKEEALLGDAPELSGEADAIERFVAGGSGTTLFEGLAGLLIEAGERSVHDLAVHQRRQPLLRQYPQLFAMKMATMRRFEDDVAAIVERRLAHDDPELARDHAALQERARLVALVAFAALRHAWTTWATSDAAIPLSERLRSSFGQLTTLFASAEA